MDAREPSQSPPVPPRGAPVERRRDQVRQTVTAQVDRRIAAVAHLSIGFGVVVGVGFLLGIAINVVIWLRSKRSSFVELHAEQAGAYQLTVLGINIVVVLLWLVGAGYLVVGGSTVTVGTVPLNQVMAGVGCLVVPAFVLWFFGTILYGLYGGLLIAAGRDFSYPVFGPWARRRLEARGRA
jgi:uncharacterized Tic20 family protein